MDRLQVFQASETFELELSLPLLEARPIHATVTAGLGRVTRLLGQFQNAQALTRHLLRGIMPTPPNASIARDEA